MPRGVPNAKRDESALRYTSFHVPLASVFYLLCEGVHSSQANSPNPKHVGSTYLKSESQTLWARNAVRAHRTRHIVDEAGAVTPTEVRIGAVTL